MTGIKKVSLVFFILAVFSFNFSPAFACISKPTPVTEAYDNADTVFIGEVVETSFSPVGDLGISNTGLILKAEEILKKWKLSPLVNNKNFYYITCLVCKIEFEKGDKYLIYAKKFDDKPDFILYERTKPLSEAKEEIAEIRQYKIPKLCM